MRSGLKVGKTQSDGTEVGNTPLCEICCEERRAGPVLCQVYVLRLIYKHALSQAFSLGVFSPISSPLSLALARPLSSSVTMSEQPPLAASGKTALPAPVVSRASTETDTNSVLRLWMAPQNVFTKEHLMSDVDPTRSTYPLVAYCFMTGYMSVFLCLNGYNG